MDQWCILKASRTTAQLHLRLLLTALTAMIILGAVLPAIAMHPSSLDEAETQQAPYGEGDDASLPSSYSSTCDDSVDELVSSCREYVMGVWPPLPSNPGACCDAVQAAPWDCVCSRVPSYVADVINHEAVKNVMHTCGVEVPAGTTCGGVDWGNR